MIARARAWAVTCALAAVVASPVVRWRGWDDYPISSYPMFSRGDLGNEVTLSHVVLERVDGTRMPASPDAIGTPEPMVAKRIVEGAIARGEARGLCERVAGRVRGSGDVRVVEVVTSVFDVRAYFETRSGSGSGSGEKAREVHARCEVGR